MYTTDPYNYSEPQTEGGFPVLKCHNLGHALRIAMTVKGMLKSLSTAVYIHITSAHSTLAKLVT